MSDQHLLGSWLGTLLVPRPIMTQLTDTYASTGNGELKSVAYELQPIPDNKVHGANMGPTWVLSAPDGPHVGPMGLAIRDVALSTWTVSHVVSLNICMLMQNNTIQ